MYFIVELEKNVWIAELHGDPGRTVVKENAQQFDNIHEAGRALEESRKYRPFEKANIICVKDCGFELVRDMPTAIIRNELSPLMNLMALVKEHEKEECEIKKYELQLLIYDQNEIALEKFDEIIRQIMILEK